MVPRQICRIGGREPATPRVKPRFIAIELGTLKPTERLRLGKGSLPSSNQEDQFLGAWIGFAHDIVCHQRAPLSAVGHREVSTGL
jgi:hypothetical protein